MVISLCNLGWPRTHYVDQASLELTEILLPVSRVLGLKAYITTPKP